jgi:two-component system, LytTR family, sensor kinase
MHGAPLTDSYLAGGLIGFTAGLAITVKLLALTIRARRLPGTPYANILLVLCALAWNIGGLARVIALAMGHSKDSELSTLALAVQFSGGATWPVPLLAIWRPFATRWWQRRIAHVLLGIATLDATLIFVALWTKVIAGATLASLITLKEFTSYNGLLLALGSVATLAGRPTSRPVRFSSLTILAGISAITFGISIGRVVQLSPALDALRIVLSEQSALLILIGTFFLFARFRFADVFIRHTLRLLLANALGIAVVLVLEGGIGERIGAMTAFPYATMVFVASVVITTALLLFAAIDRHLVAFVNEWVVQTPDYPRATRELRETLRTLTVDREIVAATQAAARRTLDLEDIPAIPIDRLPRSVWPAGIHDGGGEIIELTERSPLGRLLALPNAELLVPIRVGGDVTMVLAITPCPARQGLVTHEIDYLRTVAAQCGARLDSLRLEREMVERQSHEALLRQQLTEAELRALRAQINPHFLFNALNTIADLIVTNPTAAEAMTLRLAKVFRHVLAQSVRPLTSIGDEMEFLRAYLQIEEARFGGRLHVSIDVPPDVARDSIPSLILQPVVENALKHGLAPKPGPGHLWVSAKRHGPQVCLKVEDDGLGPMATVNGFPHARQSTGVGLSNIAQRLAVVYQDQASVSLEARDRGGTCVTILLPRDGGHA